MKILLEFGFIWWLEFIKELSKLEFTPEKSALALFAVSCCALYDPISVA